MNVTKHDGAMLLYNFAVALSGAYVAWTVTVPDRWVLMGISLGIGLVWTIYFKFAMIRRFDDHPRFADRTGDGSNVEA